jgi:membrane protease YdiL (CAAX protease family)
LSISKNFPFGFAAGLLEIETFRIRMRGRLAAIAKPPVIVEAVLATNREAGAVMDEYLAYARRGKNAWWRYILSLVLAIILAMLGLTIVFVGLKMLHLFPDDLTAELTKPKAPVPYFLWTAVLFGAFAGALMVAAWFLHGKRPGDVMGKWRWGLFFRGLVIWAAVQLLLTLIDVAIAPRSFSISASAATLPLAASALAGLIAQTFAEEFIFRGYITQGLLLLFKNPWWTAIFSGLLFGSLHIANGIPQALNAVVFGIVCSLIAIRTGGLSLTWGLHLANNYFGAVVVVSSGDVFNGSPGIVTQNAPQLMWWDLGVAVMALLAMLLVVINTRIFSLRPTV